MTKAGIPFQVVLDFFQLGMSWYRFSVSINIRLFLVIYLSDKRDIER